MIFTVIGTPAPQGSKRHVGNGVMIESSKLVKPWREDVKAAVMLAYPGGARADAVLIRGPVEMEIVFTLRRPKSAKRGALPDRKPDLSKLIRSTEDAMTEVGVFEDDARIVRLIAEKLYQGEPGALGMPGAVITVQAAQ